MPKRKAAVASVPRVIAIHRTFDEVKKGEPIFFVAEQGEKVQRLSGIRLDAFLNSINGGMQIRVSSTGYFLPILAQMQNAGAVIESAHWHATGIAKGAEPEEIVTAFLNLSPLVMKPVQIRADLHRLRQTVNLRMARVDTFKALFQRTTTAARELGFADDDNKPDWLKAEEKDNSTLKSENMRPIEKELAKVAAAIPECVILNSILDVKGAWGTAASVVAYLGDPKRFETVAAMWHYSGFHVVAGKAPKRIKGQNISYNPKLRTALWLWADSMVKNGKKWQPVYQGYKAEEMEVHLEKHPGCETVEGHSGARARRRVIKDVLKEFFRLTHGGERKGRDHAQRETQVSVVAPKKVKTARKLKKVA